MLNKIKGVFKNKIVKIIGIGIVITGVTLTAINYKNTKSKDVLTQIDRIAVVKKGDISVSVSGSGPIKSSSRYEMKSSVESRVTKVYFKEGDRVKAGDVIAQFDDTNGRQNVSKVQNTIRQDKLNQSTESNNLNNLTIKAPIDGYVSNITIKEGDNVSKNSQILTIIDKTKFVMNCNFREIHMDKIKKGTRVKVFLTGYLTYLDGTVSYVSNKGELIQDGGILYNVEIQTNNPGYSIDGAEAIIEVPDANNTIMAENSGKFKYANTIVVKSQTGGIVNRLEVKEGQFVKKDSVLAKLDNQDLKIALETSAIKHQDLNQQLADANKKLDDYKVIAPGDGVIVTQDLKVGDYVEPGNVVSVILDKDNMEFAISIDELDISKIQTGQNVNVTVDALPNTSEKPLSGKVTKIAQEGTSTNGVTTYPVTIKIAETSELKAGMNANAQILISEKKDVLVIPLEAVTKVRNKNYVTVKSTERTDNNQRNDNQRMTRNNDGSQRNTGFRNRQNNNFANSRTVTVSSNMGMRKEVQLGINNEEYVEVISGLSQGEQIILPKLATNTSNTRNSTNMQMGSPMGGIRMPITGGNSMGGNQNGNRRVIQSGGGRN